MNKYEVEDNLYFIDSSSADKSTDSMKRLADKISEEVDKNFNPEKLEKIGGRKNQKGQKKYTE